MVYGKLPLQHIKNQFQKMYAICDKEQKEISYERTDNPSVKIVIQVCLNFILESDLFLKSLRLESIRTLVNTDSSQSIMIFFLK